MNDIDKLIKRGWTVEQIQATLIRDIQDDGETITRTKVLMLDEEDLAKLAQADSKDDKKTIKELRQELRALRDARKAAKDALKKAKGE